jgi:hypothetical protein
VNEPKSIAIERRRMVLDALPAGSIGAEIGVHKGDFSAVLLEAVRPARLHLVDPWKYETAERYDKAWYGGQAEGGQAEMDERYASVLTRFDREIRAGQVVVDRGSSEEVLEQLPDEYFDWVYIDGNHLYEYVKVDLALSLRTTKAGGLITGDDYAEGGWWQGGVKKAVDEFATDDAVQLLQLQNGQYVFQKTASS